MFRQLLSCVVLALPLFVVADPIPLNTEGGYHDLGEHGIFHKFNSFALEFGKNYGSLQEHNKRYAIFKNNLKTIDKLNRKKRGTATFGITKFADLTFQEFLQKFTGGKISQAARERHAEAMKVESKVDIEFKSGIDDIRAVNGKVFLPSKFDYREKGAVTPVKHQGNCGSCWAFSVIGNIEGRWKIQKGELYDLSVQELVDCSKENYGCEGGWMAWAVQDLVELGGVVPSSAYSYKAVDGECRFNKSDAVVKVAGYKAIPSNETTIAKELVEMAPLSAAMVVKEDFMFYRSGIFSPSPAECSTDEDELNHGVLLVGYGEESTSHKGELPYWIVKNSWGADWGENGYFRLARGKNTCAISTCVSTVVL